MANKKTVDDIKKDKEQLTMETVAWRAGYYRANPQRFVKDFLGLKLKWFQQILIWVMMQFNYIMYLASRGQGKTYITALFCCIRCILYPGTKIVVVSGTLKQANEVLLKIQNEFMRQSPNLCTEIEDCKIGQNDAHIMFKNGSWITTTTSTDNARGLRANIIIVDEFRMVNPDILDGVIRKFLTAERHPRYLDKPEYADRVERNKEIYMSSAWFKSSWAWDKVKSYVASFFDDTKKYFICALPYQLSIKENLLSKEQVRDEMSESTFDDMKFKMEMEVMWQGDTGDNFFKFDEINKRRKIKNALLPLSFYNDKNPVPKLEEAAERILSLDVALMATTKKKKNDASSLFINNVIQTDDTNMQSNFVYSQTYEGKTTDELGIIIMRYFYHYKCTQLVLDCQGNGLGVYDYICKDQYDPETGDTYKALCACNNEEMAMRCKVKDANRVAWCIKANADFNDQICTGLRVGIQNGRINFLISDQDCDEVLSKTIKNWDKLNTSQQNELRMPYIQTTLAEYELIKLNSEVRNGKIKVKELSGMRKDRYSSIAYNYWCACQLELKLKPNNTETDIVDMLSKMIRPAKYD